MPDIPQILERRRAHRHWDPELWDFFERVSFVSQEDLNDRSVEPRPLENLSDTALQARLNSIERNIQYLDCADRRRDEMSPDDGWLSPWWWLRLRHWTLSEFRRRGVDIQPSPNVADPVPVGEDFRGIHSGSTPKLFRISRLPFLKDMLERGNVRFGLAAGYQKIENDEARADNEMKKGYKRSGRRVKITTLDGRQITALGDVSFDTARITSDLAKLPYWMLCFSSDLDLRLFDEFPSLERDDAVIAIFDPDEFIRRIRRAMAMRLPEVHVFPANVLYYDVYHPPRRDISPLTMKEMRFGYQREVRIVLDPGRGEAIANGAFTIGIGSIKDIAAIYTQDGRRVAGSGPDSLFV